MLPTLVGRPICATLVLLVLALPLLLAGCGGPGDTPTEALVALRKAARAGDYGGVYDVLTADTQVRIDLALQQMAQALASDEEAQSIFGCTVAEANDRDGRSLFVAILQQGNSGSRIAADADAATEAELIDGPVIDEAGTSAQLVVRYPDGREQTIQMVREDGGWRVDGRALCGTPAGGTSGAGWSLLLLLGAFGVRRRR